MCCHSNETRAPIAFTPNSAQLEGTPYPKLHPDPGSSVEMRRGTHRQTHRRAWPLYISLRLRLKRNVIRSLVRADLNVFIKLDRPLHDIVLTRSLSLPTRRVVGLDIHIPWTGTTANLAHRACDFCLQHEWPTPPPLSKAYTAQRIT